MGPPSNFLTFDEADRMDTNGAMKQVQLKLRWYHPEYKTKLWMISLNLRLQMMVASLPMMSPAESSMGL